MLRCYTITVRNDCIWDILGGAGGPGCVLLGQPSTQHPQVSGEWYEVLGIVTGNAWSHHRQDSLKPRSSGFIHFEPQQRSNRQDCPPGGCGKGTSKRRCARMSIFCLRQPIRKTKSCFHPQNGTGFWADAQLLSPAVQQIKRGSRAPQRSAAGRAVGRGLAQSDSHADQASQTWQRGPSRGHRVTESHEVAWTLDHSAE